MSFERYIFRNKRTLPWILPDYIKYGEPYVDIYDGRLFFSGYPGGTFVSSTIQPGFFEVGSKLSNLIVSGSANIGVIYSGGTDLYDIFSTSGGIGDITRVQNGINTYTAGTDNFPSVNISSATLNSLGVSGAASMNVVSAITYYLGGVNLYDIFSGSSGSSVLIKSGVNTYVEGVAGNQSVNFSAATIDHLSVSGDTSLGVVSATTIVSGSTNLYDIFLTTSDGNDVTRAQPGVNTYTAGTVNNPSVNISSATLNTLTVSGNTSLGVVSATTIVSGSTNLSSLFATSNHAHIQYATLSGATFTGIINAPTLSATTLSASTIVSGSTDLSNLFASPVHVHSQYATLSGATFTGTVNVPTLSATTLSATTIYSGGTNLNSLFAPFSLSQFPVDINRYGFLNHTETGINFDGVDLFTLSGVSWSYYRAGIKHTISGNKTVTVATPMVDSTMYYIYIDSDDGTLISATSSWTLNDTKVPVATIFWNSKLTPKFILSEERHQCIIDRATHRHEHFVEGTQYVSGCIVSGYTLNSTVETNKTFLITSTRIDDEDIALTLSGLTDGDSLTPNYYNLYRTASTVYHWSYNDMPFKYVSGATHGWIEYDNGAGVSTPSANNRFVNTYILCTNSVSNFETTTDTTTGALRYIMLQGRGSYTTAALAYAESIFSFDLAGFPFVETVAVYQLTWATNNTNTVKGRCSLNRVQRISANIVGVIAGGVSVDHNTLANLQGGQSGEYYHTTLAEYTNLTSGNFSASTISATTIYSGSTNLNSLFATMVHVHSQYATLSGATFTGTVNVPTLSATTLSASTIISGSTDLSSLFASPNHIHSQYATLSGATFTGTVNAPTLSATTLSATTIISGSTNLYDIFATSAGANDITRVQPGSNITTGGTGNNPVVSLAASPSINGLTASGATSLQTISATTIISGSTNLYDIFATSTTAGSTTSVQPGTNTYTGGTASNPSVNMSAATLNSLIVSGTTSLGTISATTICSGSTDLSNLFQAAGTGGGVSESLAIAYAVAL